MRLVCSRLLPGLRFCQYRYSRMMSTNSEQTRPLETSIRRKLTEAFQPVVLDVMNESNMHKVPRGSETHFKVLVVTDKFDKLPLIKRHRLINEALEEELQNGVLALSIVAKTPTQWEDTNGKVSKSPPCRGGAGL